MNGETGGGGAHVGICRPRCADVRQMNIRRVNKKKAMRHPPTPLTLSNISLGGGVEALTRGSGVSYVPNKLEGESDSS